MNTPETKENTKFVWSSSESSEQQIPLLPRSGWQDQQAFLKMLIRVKRSLDIAEISALISKPLTAAAREFHK